MKERKTAWKRVLGQEVGGPAYPPILHIAASAVGSQAWLGGMAVDSCHRRGAQRNPLLNLSDWTQAPYLTVVTNYP